MDNKKVSKKISTLPDLSNEVYKVEEFIYNCYGKGQPTRYGCVYNKDGEKYLFLIEDGADMSSFGFLENAQSNGIKVYYGYIPSFPLAKNLIDSSRPCISWMKGNSVFTLIKTGNTQDFTIPSLGDVLKNKEFMLVFDFVLKSKKCFGSLPFFEMIAYMPSEILNYQLATLFLIFSYLGEDSKEILVTIKGNFKHKDSKNSYINIEIGFSYSFSEKFQFLCKDFKKHNEIYKNKSDNNISEYSYINTKEKFYIKCNNNETSIEYENEIENVAKEILEIMKDYSCVEETIKLGRSR